MAVSKKTSPEAAIQAAMAPLKNISQQGDVAVTTSSALAFADSTITDGFGYRRIRVYNTDASATLGVKFIAAAATATGHAITAAIKVGPQMTFETVYSNSLRVVFVGSASLTANVIVDDLY